MRLLVLLALALIGCAEPYGAVDSSSPVETPAADEFDGRFVPATHRDGDRVVMPLVFPDGTRAELSYPPELALAALGVEPYGSATLQGDSPHPERSDRVARDFWIRYGARVEPEPTSLVFDFGRWRVEVWDHGPRNPGAMTGAERRSFQRSLSGRETDDGFLVLEAAPPLRLARAGEHAGPALQFGSPGRPPWLALKLQPCDAVTQIRSQGVWCVSDSIVAHALGDRRFLAAAAAGIRLR